MKLGIILCILILTSCQFWNGIDAKKKGNQIYCDLEITVTSVILNNCDLFKLFLINEVYSSNDINFDNFEIT